ncbi:MAG: hypothetical protein R2777_09990 [Chitinophagales bacterium]|nr:hypothetical protein [Chitinophagales bacterium]
MKQFISKSLDYFIPISIFVALFFFIYILLKTCITFSEFFKLLLFVASFISIVYYLLAKKYHWFHVSHINLLLYAYLVPVSLVFIITLNFYTAKTVYYENIYVGGQYGYRSLESLISPKKRIVEVCDRLYLTSINTEDKEYVEIEIGKGFLGYYVLKKQSFYTSKEYYLRE